MSSLGDVSGWSEDDVSSIRNLFPEGCFFSVDKIRQLPDKRHLVAPVESRADFDAVVAKYSTQAAAVAPTPVDTGANDTAIASTPTSPVVTADSLLNLSDMAQGKSLAQSYQNRIVWWNRLISVETFFSRMFRPHVSR